MRFSLYYHNLTLLVLSYLTLTNIERARKRVCKIRVAERGIVVGRKVGGRRGLPTASNANVKTGE